MSSSRKVLVTGATGFVGGWLCRHLRSLGHEVYALARQPKAAADLQKDGIQILAGDVTDLASLQRATLGMDSVFHLAGLISYKKSDRAAMDRVNIQGTEFVIQACRENKVRRLVYMSSVVAIGALFSSHEKPMTEDSAFNLSSLNLGYFMTKKRAEDLVLAAVKDSGLDAVVLNPSTIYGFGDAKKGSRKNQLKVARGELKFYPPGGVNIIAIEDVLFGITAAWEKGRSGERYILAGENLTLQRAFALIAKAAGQSAPSLPLPGWILHLMGRIGDWRAKHGHSGGFSQDNAYAATLFHWFDSSKAQRELGLKPRSASFALENSVQWMRENGLLKK